MAELDNKGWNVFILFQYYANDNDVIYDLFVSEIETVAVNSNIDFYVLKLQEDKEISYYTLPHDSTGRKLKLVKPTSTYADIYVAPFQTIKKVWLDFFNLCANKQNRNFIAIHSHGAGLGLTPKILDLPPAELTKSLIRLLSHEIISFEKFNNLKNDNAFLEKNRTIFNRIDGNISLIPISIFSEAICASDLFTGPNAIDFIYLSNCFMLCGETGFLLKDTAKYLIASEGVSISGGTNYPKLFDTFLKKLSNREIALSICKNFDERFDNEVYKNFKTKDENEIYTVRSYIDLSIVDLSKFDEFKRLLSEVGHHLLALSNNEKNFLELGYTRLNKAICREVFHNNPIGLIDICNYLYEIAIIEDIDVEAKKLIYGFINFVKHELVVATHLPTRAFLRENTFGICPSGISLFFPRNKNDNLQNEIAEFLVSEFYKKEQNLSVFLDKNEWKDFVIKFYESDIFLPTRVKFFLMKDFFMKSLS